MIKIFCSEYEKKMIHKNGFSSLSKREKVALLLILFGVIACVFFPFIGNFTSLNKICFLAYVCIEIVLSIPLIFGFYFLYHPINAKTDNDNLDERAEEKKERLKEFRFILEKYHIDDIEYIKILKSFVQDKINKNTKAISIPGYALWVLNSIIIPILMICFDKKTNDIDIIYVFLDTVLWIFGAVVLTLIIYCVISIISSINDSRIRTFRILLNDIDDFILFNKMIEESIKNNS